MDRLLDEVHAAEQALAQLQLRRAADVAARWEQYRDGYERLLQPDAEAAPSVPEDDVRRQIWNPAKPIATGVTALEPVGAAGTTEDEERP
jgi:hypothetical protein